VTTARLSGDDLCGLVETVRKRLAAKLRNRRVVLLFDEFDRNFATVANRQDSILTMNNLTDLHHFTERDRRVQFVVTYTHPIDVILNEDWYLRNFVREDVDLLSEKEARELADGGLRRRGIRPSADLISSILASGGRYPPLLTLAVDYAEVLGSDEHEEKARNVYRHLEQYIRTADNRLQWASTLKVLAEIAREPISKQTVEMSSHYGHAKVYCYAEDEFGAHVRYKILSEGFGRYLLKISNDRAGVQRQYDGEAVSDVASATHTGDRRTSPGSNNNNTVATVLANLDRIVLAECVVVGKYLRYDPVIRNTLRDWVKRIQKALIEKTISRENYLIWAASGSGKTFLIQQIAEELRVKLGNTFNYVECNLAKDDRESFINKVGSLEVQAGPTLCLLDEIDARASEDWPYEICFPKLDLNLRQDRQLVMVLIGSTPPSMQSMIESMKVRKKGRDLLDRILRDQKCLEIPPTTLEDSIAMVVGQVVALLGGRVRAVEKLALFYILSNESLRSSPRQLSEFIKGAANRLGDGDERLRFHHLFLPEDDDRRFVFRKANEDVIVGLRNVDVVVIAP